MLAAPRAITPLPLRLKNIPKIKAPISFAFSLRNHKPCFLIVSSVLRLLRDLAKTKRKVGTIKKPIVVFVAPNLKAPSQLLGSTQLRPCFETIITMIDH